jgi:predicted dipeptidase
MLLSLVLAATLTARADKVIAHYDAHQSKQLVPLLSEVLHFRTYAGNEEAHAAQKEWLRKTAKELGFVTRDAGKMTEIELPGPANAPILGLVIHGDVQPVDEEAWTFPPFEGRVENGYVLGRGAADDKGPLAQALMAMHAFAASGLKRTHTIRLLVGSEEESEAGEIAEYLKDHTPPDYSLVLDSEFPVVVGEKAWDGLAVDAPLTTRPGVTKSYHVASIDAGLAPSIVPERAEVKLVWNEGSAPDWTQLISDLQNAKLPVGTRIVTGPGADASELRVVTYGKSAHAGVNLTGGRNALVALARALEGKLPSGGADDLFAFVRMAGQDLHGTGLGITDDDPVWGRYAVNIATVKRKEDHDELFINLRRIPPRTAAEARALLQEAVAAFDRRTGASLTFDEADSYFKDEPLGFDRTSPIVRRLMDIYTRATGEQARPAISGGGTYAKRLPRSIAFGMWFPGKPYPGHDVDEKIPIADLHRGARVLIHALVDIATGPPIENAFGGRVVMKKE